MRLFHPSIVLLIGIPLSLLLVSRADASRVGANSQLIKPEARSYGMGLAFTAIAEGPAAGFWNPAALGLNSGFWLGKSEAQLVPDLADDIWMRGKHFTLSAGGIGFAFYRNYLDYGKSPITTDSPDIDGSFDSYEYINSFGLGVDLKHLGLFADNDNMQAALGANYRYFKVDLVAGHTIPEIEVPAADTWDLDLGAMWTGHLPLPEFTIEVPPLFSGLSSPDGSRYSSIGLRGGLVVKNVLAHEITFIDDEVVSPLGRFLHTGIAAEATLQSLPPFAHIVRVLVAWDRQSIMEPDIDWVENYRGFEINLLGIFSYRRGYIDDPDGDITDSTEGHGFGFDFMFENWLFTRLGFAYDYADVPQAADLDRVDKESYSLWFDLNWDLITN